MGLRQSITVDSVGRGRRPWTPLGGTPDGTPQTRTGINRKTSDDRNLHGKLDGCGCTPGPSSVHKFTDPTPPSRSPLQVPYIPVNELYLVKGLTLTELRKEVNICQISVLSVVEKWGREESGPEVNLNKDVGL